MISVQPYNERWPAEFLTYGKLLRQVLGAHALRIDHIGSTSVPGLAAKDVLDIQVTVANLADEILHQVSDAGFQHVARLTHDHIPNEWPDRDPDPWRKMVFRQPKGDRRVNCHVRQIDMPNQRYALLFRDYLRAFPIVAGGYGDMKKAAAKYHPEDDMEAYYDLKDPVTDIIYAGAEYWAKMSEWRPGPSDI